MKKIVCIIPARLRSSRLPKKILAPLNEKPLLQWVWEAAQSVSLFHSVYIAIDAEETAAVVKKFGGNYLTTAEGCPNGTSRIGELCHSGKVEADIFVNWQGDEPFLDEKTVATLLSTIESEEEVGIWTLKKKIEDKKEALSPHCVKVVTDQQDYALYFSRAPIPYQVEEAPYYKHIGFYAYRKESLLKLYSLPHSQLAEAENLEQLNFLYHGLRIKVDETQYEGWGIDTAEDLAKAALHPFFTKK